MADYHCINDFQLMHLLRSNNEEAFREIYERYNGLLFLYAYRKLLNQEEAQDVVQEVFISLWDKRDTFVLTTNLSGYLYKSVLNRVLNIFRHKNIANQYIEELARVIENPNSTDYLIREREIAHLIEREINALPPRMREVFDLRRKEYLSNKEIASKLNLSEHTVATQIKKVLKVLRLRLQLASLLCSFLFI